MTAIPRVFAIQADLTRIEEAFAAAEVVQQRFGCVDLLVNAIGLFRTTRITDGRVFATDLADLIKVNLVAPANIIAALSEVSWSVDQRENRNRNRNVVNISSAAAYARDDAKGWSGYITSKACLNALTVNLGAELSQMGVRINAIAPPSFNDKSIRATADAVVTLDHDRRTGLVL